MNKVKADPQLAATVLSDALQLADVDNEVFDALVRTFKGDLELQRSLLQARDANGMTLLMHAASEGYDAVVELVLDLAGMRRTF